MTSNKRILAVVTDRELYEKVANLLNRASLEVNRVPSGAGALILVGNLRYDLILVEAPLSDLGLQDFVAAVRTLDSPCAASSILVLTRDQEAGQLSGALLSDEVIVLPATAESSDIQREISRVLGVALRTTTRLLVQLETETDDGSKRRMGQTVNLSETGMLLSGIRAEIGSQVRLTFSLPGDSREIVSTAEVVRRTQPEVEKVSAIGVRFVELEAEAAGRLRDFVNGHSAAGVAAAPAPAGRLIDNASSSSG